MLSKEIAQINWNEKTALEIKNLVRGLNPIMGAYTIINGKTIKLWKINIISNEAMAEKGILSAQEISHAPNGDVLLASDKEGLFLKAKDAVIEVIEMQAEGAKKMNAKDYLRGNKL